MSVTNTPKDRCTYRIVRAATTEELEKLVNEIFARGWEEDGLVSSNWEFIGGAVHDEQGYYQVMVYCPLTNAEAYIQKV